MTQKIVLIDTYYPDFLNSLSPMTQGSSYSSKLRRVLNYGFGTFDAYSYHLQALGWDAEDIIANYGDLQQAWMHEQYGQVISGSDQAVVLAQIQRANPDVVFMQDLSFFDVATLKSLAQRYILAGQCSCPWPGDDRVAAFDQLFTSFPHYVDRFEALGTEGYYLSLAFDRRFRSGATRGDIDISFVGGVGRDSHWRSGSDMLEIVAGCFRRRFSWYGYGFTALSSDSALASCYRGEAWGRRLYEIYARSKIVLNRHGEVSEGYTNNLRCFEATGAGALLITEESRNLEGLFPAGTCVSYSNEADLCEKIDYYLEHDDERERIAAAGQAWTLANHNYDARMLEVSGVLAHWLESRKIEA